MSLLRDLIASEPANATRTDDEVFAWLNESVNVFVDVEWLDVNMWLVDQDIPRATLTTQATTGTPANQTAAQYLIDVVNAGQPLQASDARVRAALNASALSAAQKTALLDLATESRTRWQAAGIGQVIPADVPRAR